MTVFRYRVSTQKKCPVLSELLFPPAVWLYGCPKVQCDVEKEATLSKDQFSQSLRCPTGRRDAEQNERNNWLTLWAQFLNNVNPNRIIARCVSRQRVILGSRPQIWNASFTSSHSQTISCLVATFGLAATFELANPDPRQFLDYIRFRLAELCGGDVGARNVRVF